MLDVTRMRDEVEWARSDAVAKDVAELALCAEEVGEGVFEQFGDAAD